ncbi:MAG: hypothetical protein LQ347_002502 [Umbilicaria vellea]|nr:MAG: hypothetical protein LQ347_002502 [Umbilicaria vellea]
MYGVPFSSDESDSVVEVEQESDVSSQTHQSQRSTRKGSTRPADRTGVTVKSYARWRTQHNRETARSLGSQAPLESAQEADVDSQSADEADAPERLSAPVAPWSPWFGWSSSQPHLARRNASPYIDDSDVSFKKSLSPAMSTASLYEPADLAETTQELPIVEQLYRFIPSVFDEFDRFAQLVIPLAAAVLLVSLFVLLAAGLYHGLPSYYHNLDESSAMCDFGLTSSFLSFCRTKSLTVDSPAMDIFVDIQTMTERWISTIEGTDRAGTISRAASDAAPPILALRKALYLSDLMSSGILNKELADFVDKSEANQWSWTKYSVDGLGSFERLWTELIAFGERLKIIKKVNENQWSPVVLVIDTVRFLFPKVSHPGTIMIVNATVSYLSFLSDEIETRLLPQGKELRKNFTLIEEAAQRIENMCKNEAGLNSHPRSNKRIWRVWPFDHEENFDWFIQQKQSLKLYELHRRECITQIDTVLEIYRDIGDDIKDLIERLEAPAAMKGFDQAHFESQIRNIDTLGFRLKFTNFEKPGKRTGTVSPILKHSEEDPISTEASPEKSRTGEAGPTSSAASPETIQTAQHDPPPNGNPPAPIRTGDAHLTSSAASPKASRDRREGLPTIEAYPEARRTVKEPTGKRPLSRSEAYHEVSLMEESTHES